MNPNSKQEEPKTPLLPYVLKMQFDDDEPIEIEKVDNASKISLSLTAPSEIKDGVNVINNNEIVFTSNGKKLRLFIEKTQENETTN